MTKFILTTILALFAYGELATAQDLPTARQRGNADFIEVVHVKYKTGMSGTAGMYWFRYFNPASEKAGTPTPVILHMQTGDWDAMLFFNRGKSMARFDWPVHADDEKWWAALAELNGGPEAAQKIMADYNAMIARETQSISHRHLPPAD